MRFKTSYAVIDTVPDILNKTTFKILAFTFAFVLFTGCAVKEDNTAPSFKEKTKTEEFKNISVSIASGDIKIKEGEDFSFSYHLHEKEKVTESFVSDGTFYFETDIDFKFKPDHGDFFLEITVPKDLEISEVLLSSVAGDIEIENRSFQKAYLKTVSGDIELKNAEGKIMDAKTTSGKIKAENSNIASLISDNTSGDISFSGNFENAEINTVSGDIYLKGDLKNEAHLKTVSGDIEVFADVNSVEAESIGKIEYKKNMQGKKLNLENGSPKVFAKSVSGKIEID